MKLAPAALEKASPVAVLLAAIVVASGCHHVIEPLKPRRLDLNRRQLPPGVTLRIENGYAGSEMRNIRSDVVHQLDVDLRDWSARLVSELQSELERLGASCSVPASALAGTAVAPLPFSPLPVRLKDDDWRVIRVRITDVTAADPETDQSAHILASMESSAGDFAAFYSTGPGLKGFSDALFELKGRILEDPRFLEWLMNVHPGAGKPSDD